mmetsp:Transcript_34581/g.62244  ORF Transcript_34581/g.62244 Transcript_34581/m.62244 type:complete len:340 (-) Transcript_34581:152-1171(-)|eukprot:CAMPEP_0201932224 /NCGR_PEP_ID=MMETSP0903-20130614/29029_1 /ASSEMBLY_ACC=CAM_ASM_000552 /TAXON_ID=420261 /ORGANISM="Thalassiosira antarctica, Strain CCMP982" /LENGTH=339 /DNA_ID=CAMNT_0048471787 /DNA_START=93 /DNA_END=1112 /DNA_ORIENTATION=+
MSQGYSLTKLVSSIEERPSPIHGKGIFATSSIKAGEYSILPDDPKVIKMVEKFSPVNSAMMPIWKDILLTTNGSSDDEDGSNDNNNADATDNDAANKFTKRLDQFQKGFATFMEEEKSKANITSTVALRAVTHGVDFTVRINRDLKDGEELLRPYGREWLAIKYYHLRSCVLNYYRERMMQEEDDDGGCSGDLILSVDVNLLHVTVWELKTNRAGQDTTTNADKLGRFLSKREGKELIVVSPEELNSLANILGLVALEATGTTDGTDEGFDFTWEHNIRKLRRNFPKQVIFPASFSSCRMEHEKSTTTKKAKAKKRKHDDNEVEKLKHGVFDVYKRKKM